MLQKGNLFSMHVEGVTPLYALAVNIEPDVKDDWWVLTYKFLGLYPAKEQTIIVRTAYLDGQSFQMQGYTTQFKVEEVLTNTPEITPYHDLALMPEGVIDFAAEKAKRR